VSPRRATLGVVLALGLLAAPLRARAQSTGPGGGAEAGRALYSAGAAAYAAGNFAAAVQALTEAYRMAPRPGVLFSLAQAERQLYTLEHRPSVLHDAVNHYRAYVEQTAQGGRRADAVEALGDLEAESARLGNTGAERSEPAHPAQTRLMVSTSPKDATVTVDGVDYRDAPVIVESAPGAHSVTVRAPGYFDDTRTLTAVEGSLVASEIALRERPAHVRLNVPYGTEIVLDGKPQGTAPLADLEVAGGSHLIGLTLWGHVAQLRTVAVEHGATAVVSAPLELTTQRKVSYGVLAAGGAGVLAGGAAGVVALVLQSNAQGVRDAAAQGNIGQSQLDSYNESVMLRDRWRTAAAVSLSIGGVLAATGVVLYAFDHAQPGEGQLKPGSIAAGVHVDSSGVAVAF
jgi:hypothetical protein